MNDLKELQVNRLSIGNALDWMIFGWGYLKRYYSVMLMLGLFSLILGLIQQISLFGIAFSAIMPLVSLGYFKIYDDMSFDRDINLSDLFLAFRESGLIKKLLPIIMINLISDGVIYFTMPNIDMNNVQNMDLSTIGPFIGGMFLLSISIKALVFLITAFSVPLIYFDQLSFVDTVIPNIKGLFKNLDIYIGYLILSFIFGFFSLILLFFPFVFIYLPIIQMVSYFQYYGIFRNSNYDRVDPQKKPD